jgi:hypothetical protein
MRDRFYLLSSWRSFVLSYLSYPENLARNLNPSKRYNRRRFLAWVCVLNTLHGFDSRRASTTLFSLNYRQLPVLGVVLDCRPHERTRARIATRFVRFHDESHGGMDRAAASKKHFHGTAHFGQSEIGTIAARGGRSTSNFPGARD